MSFSLVINSSPWRIERWRACEEMRCALITSETQASTPFWVNEADYRGTDWQQSKVKWALDQWRWALSTQATHHVFMTDDLHIAPKFWTILLAMLKVVPDKPIGLLSNHPRSLELVSKDVHWYRTNSWLVGPAYVMPRALLERFVAWFEALPDGPHTVEGTKAYRNDDSSLNEWITRKGPGETWHPLPTIIEHRHDIESTVGHGDRFSRERVSWRTMRTYVDGNGWTEWPCGGFAVDDLCNVDWWKTEAPMLAVGG